MDSSIALAPTQDLKDKIYTIREVQVMLEFDLAQIYGYTTTAFNQQVKRNIEKFPSDFMFELTREEMDELSMSQNVTSIQKGGIRGGRAKPIKAFTEQGIYMLMTVLKGELATEQSKRLIRLFKQMKDALVQIQPALYGTNPVAALALEVGDLKEDVQAIKTDLAATKDTLASFMAGFGADHERLYICGASSKDAGKRVTMLIESNNPKLYDDLIEGLLGNLPLRLK